MAVTGALPARFRQPRVLVVGCGDVGMRALPRLNGVRVLALTSSPQRVAVLRAAGAVPLLGNLDQPASVRRLAGLAQRVLHLAPPPSGPADASRRDDPRTRTLVRALARGRKPLALAYGSTSGVYGDCAGAWVDETRPVRPQTARAHRRVAAENTLRDWGRRAGVPVAVLRIPGIYAPDRAGGTPRERLLRGSPVLHAAEDVFTNHIHADDLARACVRALWCAPVQRVFHVCDDTELHMGDYMDLAADLYRLPRPPRVTRAEAAQQLSPMVLSFMGESRRLRNTRLKRELGLRLQCPTVVQGLQPHLNC